MMVGWQQLLIILVIVLIVFGPGRLPDVFKKAGEGIRAFKDASEGKGKAEGEAKAAEGEDDEHEEVVVRRKKKKPPQITEDELDDAAADKEKAGSAERKA